MSSKFDVGVAAPVNEDRGVVLDDELVAAKSVASVSCAPGAAIRAMPVARATSVQWVPAAIKFSLLSEWPRAPFVARIRWVCGVATAVAFVDHVAEHEVAKHARLLRKLARNVVVHFCSGGRLVRAADDDVCMR